MCLSSFVLLCVVCSVCSPDLSIKIVVQKFHSRSVASSEACAFGKMTATLKVVLESLNLISETTSK